MSVTQKILERLTETSRNKKGENSQLFKRLKKKKPKDLDETVHQLHYEIFDYIDCLECANCCKTISPILYNKDIDRLASRLRIKPSEFVSQYLEIDEENDYVFRETPCPFLMPDNYCMVYEARPKACREYPHTDRKRFHQILNLTLKNCSVCPAVHEVIERLKKTKKY